MIGEGRPATRSGVGALLMGLLVLLAVPATAAAQDAPATRTNARLVLTDIDSVVGPGAASSGSDASAGAGGAADTPRQAQIAATSADEDLDLRLLVENVGNVDLSSLQVVVEVHPAVEARSVLQQSLDQQTLDTPLQGLTRVDVREGATLASGEITGLEVTVPAERLAWEGTNQVHPVQVSVLLGAQVLDRLVTAVVHLADVPDAPLQASVVWPVDGPTGRTARGRYEQALPDDLAPGGRIDVLLSALEQHAGAAVLIAPESGLVEELADRGDGFVLTDGSRVAADASAARRAAHLLARLRALVEESPLDPVIGPYAGADVAALAAGSETVAPLAGVAIDAARTRTQALLGRAPDLGLYLGTTPVTQVLLQHLAAERVLLSYDQVVGPALDTYPDLPAADRTLRGVTGQAAPDRAMVADPHVTQILADPPDDAGPVAARQRLVAETALLYLTAPGQQRSLLAMPPSTWSPDGPAAHHLLDALVGTPWLDLGRPEGSGATDPAVLASPDTTLPPDVDQALADTQRTLEALRRAMPEGIDPLAGQTVADLEDALLRAVTPDTLRGDGATARNRVGAVAEVAESAFGDVQLAEDVQVTLTSDTGEVPVTVERTDGREIELLVEVRSPNALQWQDDGRTQQVTLPADASRTLSFDARALSRGTFPVTVYVWDPTHERLLDSTTMSVRSTSISRTALVVVGVVVVGLLVLGLVRRRAPRLEVVR